MIEKLIEFEDHDLIVGTFGQDRNGVPKNDLMYKERSRGVLYSVEEIYLKFNRELDEVYLENYRRQINSTPNRQPRQSHVVTGSSQSASVKRQEPTTIRHEETYQGKTADQWQRGSLWVNDQNRRKKLDRLRKYKEP